MAKNVVQQQIDEIKSLLAGDGSIRGRMNAAPGGQDVPKHILNLVEDLRSKGITPDQVEAELKRRAKADRTQYPE